MVGIGMSCEESILMNENSPQNKPNPYFLIHEIGNHLSVRELKKKTLLLSLFLFKHIEQRINNNIVKIDGEKYYIFSLSYSRYI